MSSDIGQDILSSVRADFAKALDDKSGRLGRLFRKIQDGSATMSDVSTFSVLIGQTVSSAVEKQITPDVLPDGTLYFNIAQTVLQGVLRDSHELINLAAQSVQERLDAQQGLHIRAVKPEYPEERVKTIAGAASNASMNKNEEKEERRLTSPVENVVQSFYSDYVRENADLRSKAGLNAYIIRRTSGRCCPWCSGLAGRYRYEDAPSDIYARHDNCTCTVDFVTNNYRQDVWNKRKYSLSPEERRKALEAAPKPTRYTREQARELQNRALNNFDVYIDNNLQVQNYRPIVLDRDNYISTNRDGTNVSFYRANNAVNEIFISDSVKIKRKDFHNFDKNITEAYKLLNSSVEDKRPQICIMSPEQMKTSAIGSFSPKMNLLFINSMYFNFKEISEIQADFACPDNPMSTVIYELIHWQDAEDYKKKFGEIKDYSEYIDYLNKKFAPKLEKLQEKGYNIDSISPYAKNQFARGRFDEVYTEYRVKQVLKG